MNEVKPRPNTDNPILARARVLRRTAMDAASIRIPHEEMAEAKKAAKEFRCQLADIFRTAIHEWLVSYTPAGEA